MEITLSCPSCNLSQAQFTVQLLPKNDCVYRIECPNGHEFTANILYHDFQKLFEVAVYALADDYYREAVGSFAASYERFMELSIRIIMKANGVNAEILESGWKAISRQSERQLGAFVFLFLREFSHKPQLLADKQVHLRNRVIHQGYFPDREECLKYGAEVLASIRSSIQTLYSSERHNSELIRSINDKGDFSPGGPRYHYLARPFILTNSPPGQGFKTLEEMLDFVIKSRKG
jgi:hypothetical protein